QRLRRQRRRIQPFDGTGEAWQHAFDREICLCPGGDLREDAGVRRRRRDISGGNVNQQGRAARRLEQLQCQNKGLFDFGKVGSEWEKWQQSVIFEGYQCTFGAVRNILTVDRGNLETSWNFAGFLRLSQQLGLESRAVRSMPWRALSTKRTASR